MSVYQRRISYALFEGSLIVILALPEPPNPNNVDTIASKVISNSNIQNKSYLFEFDVKNVPLGSKEDKENADEDDDSEFRVCAFVDKSKKNYKKVVCENIIVNSPKENLTLMVK